MGKDSSSRYQKLAQRDHILLRPDSYVGEHSYKLLTKNYKNCKTLIKILRTKNTKKHFGRLG